MQDFSKKEPDRSLSQEELSPLSEKELAKRTFLRNIKNLALFGFGAIVACYIIDRFGTVGMVIGWLIIVIYIAFTLEALLSFSKTFISLVTITTNRRWQLIQLLILVTVATLYVTFALYIYAKISSTNV